MLTFNAMHRNTSFRTVMLLLLFKPRCTFITVIIKFEQFAGGTRRAS